MTIFSSQNALIAAQCVSPDLNHHGAYIMATNHISVRTDSELKAKAQLILSELGLDMSTAINVFLQQVVYKNGIPFEITKPVEKSAKLGGWEGKITVADDFNEPMDEFKEYMQ